MAIESVGSASSMQAGFVVEPTPNGGKEAPAEDGGKGIAEAPQAQGSRDVFDDGPGGYGMKEWPDGGANPPRPPEGLDPSRMDSMPNNNLMGTPRNEQQFEQNLNQWIERMRNREIRV